MKPVAPLIKPETVIDMTGTSLNLSVLMYVIEVAIRYGEVGIKNVGGNATVLKQVAHVKALMAPKEG